MSKPPIIDWIEKTPRSVAFDDVYFSQQDGLAETHHVFLDRGNLFEAYADRPNLCVGELGFGTGLNILVLLQLWRKVNQDRWLTIYSVDNKLLHPVDCYKALSHWPEIADSLALLLAQWPTRTYGHHVISLRSYRATFILSQMDVKEALSAYTHPVDIWFLDGFSPAKNPQMWSNEIFDFIDERSVLGTRLMTFSVAGHVRRKLEARGFEVVKRPGFGRKRHCLKAVKKASTIATLSQKPPQKKEPMAGLSLSRGNGKKKNRKIAIIGGGIAGTMLAYFAGLYGVHATLFDEYAFDQDAKDCSRQGFLPFALLSPRMDLDLFGPSRSFFLSCYFNAIAFYRQHFAAQLSAAPVCIFRSSDSDLKKFTRLSNEFEQLTDWFRFEHASEKERLILRKGAILQACKVLEKARTLFNTDVVGSKVTKMTYSSSDRTFILSCSGSVRSEDCFDAVFLANSVALRHFIDHDKIPQRNLVGQLMRVETRDNEIDATSPAGFLGDSYLIRCEGDVSAGANFHAFEQLADAENFLRKGRDQMALENIEELNKLLKTIEENGFSPPLRRASGAKLGHSWSGIRAATNDQAPICGQIPDWDALENHFIANRHCAIQLNVLPEQVNNGSLYALTGLGARGFTIAPLLAHHLISSYALEKPILDQRSSLYCHPARFFFRQWKRK